MKLEVISIKVPKDTKAIIRRFCRKEKIGISEWMRLAIYRALKMSARKAIKKSKLVRGRKSK